MTREQAQHAKQLALAADPEFFYKIVIKQQSPWHDACVCICYATEACYYVADTIEKVADASRFMLDSVGTFPQT